MNQKKSISTIIIAKNELARIVECIKSVYWTDQVIVVDNGSTDGTQEAVKKLNVTLIVCEGNNFSLLRNEGAKVAIGSWLLYIDADELVTKELQNEIAKKIETDAYSGYFITRKNYYLGAQWPTKDKMIRLIKKDKLNDWVGELHEHPNIQGNIGDLHESLIHNTHRTLSEMVEKTNTWSNTEANLRLQAKHPPMVEWRFIRVMISAFWKSYICEGGWRAGIVGWIESIYQAFSMFITYAKLWERQQKKS